MPLPAILARPRTSRLADAILSLQPTAYWPMDDRGGPVVRDVSRNWNATLTGAPAPVAAPAPISRAIAWPGGAVYADTATGIPNASGAMSLFALFRTADASAAVRAILARAAPSQWSFTLHLTATHTLAWQPHQAAAAQHATVNPAGAMNDGLWHAVTATFDSTTAYLHIDGATSSSASLTGSWHTASTAAVSISNRVTLLPWIGDLAHIAYWSDRALPVGTHHFLRRIAMGG